MPSQQRPHSRRPRIAPALRPLTTAVLLALAANAGAQVLPTGFAVDTGTVATPVVTTNPGGATETMTINQGSQNAIINWQTFSIGDGYTVNFNQPGVTSIAINRVIGESASNILGNLNANGRIFLINTNGVLFGRTAQVNVGGLVASALDLASVDFDNGVFVFSGGSGVVENQGSIVAGDRGTVALLGNEVSNTAIGSIVAPHGSIAMGAGERITLDFEGDGLTQIVVDGEFTDGQVTNAGLLQADGGNVTLAAIADGDGDGLSILHTGIIRARTLENRQGRVVLSAGNDIEIRGGTIDVSGREAGQLGGSIDIHGDNVLIDEPEVVVTFVPPPVSATAVDNPAHLDASGVAGGGSIRINADNVVVVTGTRGLDASATGNGDGGSVELFGTNGARIFGDLRARGGASGGDGGFIETSGGGVDLRGIGIDTSAPNGNAGTWLIDPFDVDIVAGAAAGTLPTNPFDPVATSIIQDGDINNALDAGSSVRITTGDPAAGNPGDGDITIGEGVAIVRSTGTAPLTFQLDANRAIFGADFSIDGGTGPLDVLFNANANGTADPTGEDAGIVLDDATINTRGGNFWLYGQSDPVNGLAGGEEEGITLTVVDVDTRDAAGNGGEIRLRGRGGNSGVEVIDSSLLSGSGDINLFGSTVFSGTGMLVGDFDGDGRTVLQTTGGDINITGLALEFFSGGASVPGSTQIGVDISDASVLADGGNIDVRGRAVGDVDPVGDTTAIGVRLGNTAEVGNALTVNTRLAGESVDSGNFQTGLQVNAGCGNGGACIGGDVVVVQAGTSDDSLALTLDGTVQGESVVNLRPGGVDATGLAYDRTGDTITIGAGGGFSVGAGDLANITAPELVFGSDTHVGLIQVQEALARAGNLTLQNAGAGAAGIVLGAAVDVGAGTLALISDGDITQTAAGSITADSLLARSTGGDVLLSTATNNVSGNTLAGDAAGEFNYTDADALAIGTVTAVGFSATTGTQALTATGVGAGTDAFVRNLTGDLVLNTGVTAGNDIDLVTAGRLQNLAGATLSAGNTWRVWADTWIGETRGGLAGSGTLPNLYNCTFAGACGITVPVADNHFIYAAQPTATITIGDALREYGLDNPALTFTVGGMILGDIAGNAISGEPATGATILSDVGDYPIGGAFDSPAGYAINLIPGTLTIDPATLTFIADPFTRIYGDPNGVLGGTVTGFRNDEDLGSATEGALTFTSTADEFFDVGTYAIVGGGLSAGNYVFVQDPGNATALTIDPATLTFVADPFTRIYGDPNGVLGGTVTGFRNDEDLGSATEGTLAFTSTADEFSDVGNYAIVGGGLGAGNYVFVQDPGNATALTIDPATLTFIADPFTRLLGQPNGLFTGIVTGFHNGDDLSSATEGTLAFTSTADQFSPVGSYAIDGSGLDATNYVFVQDPGNATALTVIGPVGSVFPPDVVRDPPDNYVYNSNLGSPQMCALVDVMAGAQGREGDNLAREWSRVRSRPNLTNCVQTNRRNGCADF